MIFRVTIKHMMGGQLVTTIILLNRNYGWTVQEKAAQIADLLKTQQVISLRDSVGKVHIFPRARIEYISVT